MIKSLIKIDSTPSEVQIKLAIAQVLSMPSFYNEPVIVIDFNVNDNGNITGKFKDYDRPRLFEFLIDTNEETVSFKHYNPERNDSEETEFNIEAWETFSKGYSYRLDKTTEVKAIKRKQCVKPTAYNCGSSCINVKKTCRVVAKDAISKSRIKKLKALGVDWRNLLNRPKKHPVTGGGGGGISIPDKTPPKPPEAETKPLEKITPTPEPTANNEIKDEETNQQRKERLLKESKDVRLKLLNLRDSYLQRNGELGEKITTKERPENAIASSIRNLEKLVNNASIDSLVEESKSRLEQAKNFSVETEGYLKKCRELIYVKNPTPIKPKVTTSKEDIKQASLDGVSLLSKMVDIPKLSKTYLKMTGTPGGKTRSFYRDGDSTVYMGKTDRATVIHELGHWIEDNVPGVAKEIKEFYNKRTEGEKIRRLKDVTEIKSYENSEITKVDKWLNPYMGKIYPRGSEILSMGLEMMHRNPAYLADKDPEMFDFIYSVVRRGND